MTTERGCEIEWWRLRAVDASKSWHSKFAGKSQQVEPLPIITFTLTTPDALSAASTLALAKSFIQQAHKCIRHLRRWSVHLFKSRWVLESLQRLNLWKYSYLRCDVRIEAEFLSRTSLRDRKQGSRKFGKLFQKTKNHIRQKAEITKQNENFEIIVWANYSIQWYTFSE